MKHIFGLVALMLLCGNVFAITWEETPHLIDNAAVSFAGEPAMQAVGDTIYIAYLAAVDDVSSCLYFAKSRAGLTYTTPVSSYMSDLPIEDPGAPSLVLDLPKITILVKKGERLYQFYSDDYGDQWNEQEPYGPAFHDNDPYPLMSSTETGIKYFTVKSQAELGGYMLFTDNVDATNGTRLYFAGYDVVTGPVRTNADLRIKQVGGGDNGGWPTFLAPVITAGHVISTPSSYPLNQVFRGGLIEEADVTQPYFYWLGQDFASEALLVGPAENGNHIVLLEVDGDTASGYLGVYSPPRRVRANVYDSYPPAGDSLYTNSFTVVDTLWTPIAPFQMPEKLYTKGDLWLKGSFSGQKSIYSESNIYLIGDILLSGTPVGESPLGNLTDKVSLISDKQIIVKYGYKNPADSLRIHPNMGADTEYPAPAGGGIFIYADLIAMNDGQGNTFNDGNFTFEYQHPHPSTPALNVEITHPDGTQEMELFDWIDIHRRRYFPTHAQPWPSPALEQTRLDLPYYNPLWPERQPYLERGTVNLWGSLYEKRRGFMHRSHNDSEYPSNAGIWDIYTDKCGYPTNPVLIMDPVLGNIGLMSRNYPGAAGSGVGYKRNHQYDPRSFPGMPKMDILGMGAKIYESIGFEEPSLLVKWHKLNEPVVHKTMDQINGQFLYHLNNTLFTDEEAYPQNLPDDWEIIQAKLLSNGHVISLQKNTGDDSPSCRLVVSDLEQSSSSVIHESPYTRDYISLHRVLDGFLYVIPGDTDNSATLIRLDANGKILSADDTLPLTAGFGSDSILASRITLSSPEPGILHACLWANSSLLGAPLWHLQGNIDPLSAHDPVIVPSALSISCFPNPFSDTISLKVESPTSQPVKIDIYNVKGQKVKSLQLYTRSGSGQITWNGNDEKGMPVAQGVYFARIADVQHSKISKILKIR